MAGPYFGRCGGRGTGSRRLAATAALLSLAACAGQGPPPDRPPGRGPGERPPARGLLFVSPAGEPFRAAPGAPYPVAAWFRQADADGDGRLDREEFVADATRFFHVLDANGDGVVDGMEVRAYETQMVPEIVQDRGPGAGGGPGAGRQGGEMGGGMGGGGIGGGRGGGRRGGGMGRGGGPRGGGMRPGGGGGGTPQAEGAAPYGLLAEREPVAGADLNLDGRITLANFQARAAQRFVRLDSMGRGYLLLTDLPKTQAQLQAERRATRRAQDRPPG